MNRKNPPTATDQAAAAYAEKLRDAGKFDEAAAFETRDVQALKLTRPAIVPGIPGTAAAGSVLLLVPAKLPPGFVTASTAAQLLANGAAVSVPLADAMAAAAQSAE